MRLWGSFFIVAALLATPICLYAEQLKVALILEHDQPAPWTNLLRKGLSDAVRQFDIAAEVVIAPADADQTAIFRETAARSDLVLVASDNLHEILRDNASSFRRVKFGSIDAGIRASNIMSVTFADEQPAFLAGVAAAMLARAKNPKNDNMTIGWLAGEDTPAMRTLINGFNEGIKLANPDGRLATAVAGSFVDGMAAARKASWLAEQGVKIVTIAAGNGNDAARALFSDIPVIEVDSYRQGSFCAIVKAADRAVLEIAGSAAQDKFRAKEIVIYDLANNGVNIEGLEAFLSASSLPNGADILRRVRELRHELASGSIKIRSLRARTLCDCLD